MGGHLGSDLMKGRKLRSGSLVALLGALILVLGAAPSLAERKPAEILETFPDKGKRTYPHKAPRVTVKFKEALVAQGTEGKEPTIFVQDACGRTLSGATTRALAPEGEEWVEKAMVELDRRKKNPSGVYSVSISYWLASDEGNPDDPGGEDPPNQEPRTYDYSFHVHGGPNCDGSDDPGHPGHGGGGDNGGKDHVWGNTSGSGHDHDGGHAGHENLRSPKGTNDSTRVSHSRDTRSPYRFRLLHESDHPVGSRPQRSHRLDHAFRRGRLRGLRRHHWNSATVGPHRPLALQLGGRADSPRGRGPADP